MVTHELEYNGRLALFCLAHLGRRVVSASGYLIHEEGQARLYLVSLCQERLAPPHRLGHVALARFAKALRATHLVPVDHGMPSVLGRVTPAVLDGGFVPALPPATLDELDAKLRALVT
jgi:hypothetical protein